jgi:hypothetical protein
MKGEILVAEETATLLGPVFVNWARRLYSIQVKGKGEEVMLCELVWRRTADMTAMAGARSVARSSRAALRLKYRDREIVRRRDNESIAIGREQSCGVVIADQNASRQHCTIERRQDKFVLKDHSSNGTFVTVDGDIEILLQREEFTLRKHGWIAFGQSRAGHRGSRRVFLRMKPRRSSFHSDRIFASRTTLRHFSRSSRMVAASCAGVPGAGS